jgi:hypothetical protein
MKRDAHRTQEIHAPLDAALGALRSARAIADNMGDEAGRFLSSKSASLAQALEELIAEVPKRSLEEEIAALRAENADLNDELEIARRGIRWWQRWWNDEGQPTPPADEEQTNEA